MGVSDQDDEKREDGPRPQGRPRAEEERPRSSLAPSSVSIASVAGEVRPEVRDAEKADLSNGVRDTEKADLSDGEDYTRREANGEPSGQREEEEEEGDETNDAARARSRASSSRSRPVVVVPVSDRRGLLSRFSLIPEVERPYDYSRRTKWTITLAVALAAAGGPLGSAIFYPALPQMAVDLHATKTVTNLSVAFYMLAMSIFPLWWSSFSELYGRRSIYIISFALFVVFSVASALSVNIAMLVVFRLLGGGASASVQAVGAGTIADVWEPRERGQAMGIFYLGPLMGPLLAPVIGGSLGQAFGWASTMWFLAIYGGVILVMLVFLLPETLARRKPSAAAAAPATTTTTETMATAPGDRPKGQGEEEAGGGLARSKTRESVQVRTRRAVRVVKQIFVDPLRVLLYLRFPPVAITVYYAAITFGSLFAMNIAVQEAFSSAPYDFGQLVVGLLYLPSALGYVLAAVLGGRWIDHIMAREARKAGRYGENGKLIYLPEDRMRENAWIAGTVYPASLIYFGWTLDAGFFWLVPCIGLFTFGAGSMLVFSAATTMLTEFMPRRSSSGVAVNNFVRNIFSCVGAIVAQPIINGIGTGWLFTILGIFSWVTGYLCVWSLKRYGPEWRKSMDAALNN